MKRHLPALLVLGAALAWSAAPRTHAQPAAPAPAAYSFIMSPAQVRALIAAWHQGGGYMPGETLVKFKDGMAPGDETRALSVLRRGTTGASTKWIGDVLMVSTPLDGDARAIAATLAQQPEVEWAQPNYIRRLKSRPNDPDYSHQWNFDLVNMPAAWDINKGATSAVTVAVIDSGVTTTDATYSFSLWTGGGFETVAIPFRINPDISPARIKPGRDFVFWNGPVLDTDGHGTHVAATILEETNNGFGAAGIAYQASLLPLKVCLSYWDVQLLAGMAGEPGFVDPGVGGLCVDSAIAEAMRFAADSGAQVINVSLGGEGTAPALRDALNYAVGHGSVVTMSAGNEFDQGNPVEYPAAYAAQIDGALSVGAVGRSSRRAPYSNTGSWVEIVAPGGDFDDGGVNGLVMQMNLVYTDFGPGTTRPRFDRYAEILIEGTSIAAPHVAGVAALLVSQGITRPAAVEAAITSSARDLGTTGRDADFGYGLLNARAALRGMGLTR